MSKRITHPISVLALALVLVGIVSSDLAAREPSDGPDKVVRDLYDLVTFPGDATPDWDVARGMFLEDAVVVLRTSREGNTVFSVEGWIDDFVTFIENSTAKETGFSETILKMQTVTMGDIANIWVLYESKLEGRPGREGVDNFSLVKHDGKWLIASIINELPIGGATVPEMLR